MATNALEKIKNELETLSESEQLLLAKMIIDRLVNKNIKYLDFRDLRGAGKGTWSKDDIEPFIKAERDQWQRD